jgi:dephospho-CoA kinase
LDNKGFKIVAIVGMAGSGKSEAAAVFESNGFKRIRFGDITDEEVRRRNLDLNEENERRVREDLRKRHGMAAYAVLNLPRIRNALEKSPVVIDGLYSWEEYKYLSDELSGDFIIVAVWSPPSIRYERLQKRRVRPLKPEEARSRDYAEIENANKGGPIAMADYTIINDSSVECLRRRTADIVRKLK